MYIERWIPMRAQSKKRPIVTRKGTYMPKPYREWRTAFAVMLREIFEDPFFGPIGIQLEFHSDKTRIAVWDTHTSRPKHLKRTDIDNLIGGVMDAMQEAELVEDDLQIVMVMAEIAEGDA